MKATQVRLWPTAIVMRRKSGHILSAVSATAALVWAAPIAAQSGEAVSRAVVQPLPPPGVGDLNEALRRLARNSADLDALIDAGNASLELNDVDAAIGFFGRAQELSPGDPRIKLGLAGAYVRSERPIDALRLFEEAERGGASTAAFAADRGLAYDLVGDNAAAQAQYRLALAAGQDPETVRRLALSQAIAGDREAFEKTLYPQLADENFAGFRARAFGLAILGDEEEAVAIAEAVMPADLSARISPYLRYMVRLTKAQQAAAVNLGIFPRAAQIGRDDPRIAQYIASASPARSVGARLAPEGEPLGSRAPEDSEAQRRRPDRAFSSVGNATSASEPAPQRVARAVDNSIDPRQRIVPQAARDPAPAAAAPPAVAPPAEETVQRAVSRPVVQQIPAPAPTSTLASQAPAVSGELPPATPSASQPSRIVLGDTATPAPGFDLGSVPASRVASTTAAAALPEPEPEPASVADAFAGFTLSPAAPVTTPSGAVDITAIEPPREVERKPPPEPEPPAHPSRHWVQVATGKNVEAFKWDWRRISRKAPEILGDFEPMTTPWVEANRLLAGPFESEKAADETVAKLREAEVDSFTFTSEEGQEIVPLD